MKWLRSRRQRTEEMAAEQVSPEPTAPDSPNPRLLILVQDAAGPASYQFHAFEDAQSAAAFIQFWFPPGLERGILAFWASDQEPVRQADSNDERSAEVVVLIRDETRPGIVYPFSHSSMGLAHSWIAKEAARGLNLRLVLVYWAHSVRIETDDSGMVRLTPAAPPMARAQDTPATGREAAPPLLETAEIVEEAARVVEAVEMGFEEIDWDAELESEEIDWDVEPDPPMIFEDDDLEPQEDAGPAGLEANEGEEDQMLDGDFVEMDTDAEPSTEDGETVKHPAQGEQEWEAGDTETLDEAAWDAEEIPPEPAKDLGSRRFEQREEPFQGFGSPEGKF